MGRKGKEENGKTEKNGRKREEKKGNSHVGNYSLYL